MLKRKIYNTLLDWKNNKSNECLMIKGARQVGKTYIVREFGNKEYKSFVEINFIKNPSLKEIFRGDIDGNTIYAKMSAYIRDINLIEHETLIFLDEIQVCSDARTALKFLAEYGKYDVIASGSLLGLHYMQDSDPDVTEVKSLPVGYERSVMMYSLDFEEYLWARGYNSSAIEYLKTLFFNLEKVPDVLNKKYEELFTEYIITGGMPEVVNSFVTHNDYNEVQKIQDKILGAYDDDIIKHAKSVEIGKIRACYDSLPMQLSRENKKFKYSTVEKKSTAKKYSSSIRWLIDANLVHPCHNVSSPDLSLYGNSIENEFKLYFNDTGLLMARYGMEVKLALLSGKLKGNTKGGIYENIIAEILVKKGYPLYYFKNHSNTMEIEFLIEKDADIVPIEVKAGNTSSISLNYFIDNKHPTIAYKLINGNIGITPPKITIPHYMSLFI